MKPLVSITRRNHVWHLKYKQKLKMKTKVSSSAIWEDSIGYSRAVKVGNIIEVAGTTAVRNGDVVHTGDPYNQAKYIIKIIDHVLKQLDSGLEDVVRTRIYLKHVGDWEEVGKAHGEFSEQ